MVRFSWLSGDVNWQDYGGKWVSNRQNNGQFDYWFVIELINWENSCGRDADSLPTYNVSLSAVSFADCPAADISRALDSWGITSEQMGQVTDSDTAAMMRVECLHSYGIHCPMSEASGNNYRQLIQQAKTEARNAAANDLAAALARPVNKIGSTGAEFMVGDVMSAIHRAPGIEGRIIRKMHGIPETN